MLIHKLDMDRAFDLTIKQALPYLIFPSDDFKLKLSGMLSSLYQYYSERNEIKFEQLNNDIELMIENVCLDSSTDITLFNFKYQQQTLDQVQQRMNERMAKTEAFLSEIGDVKSRLFKLEQTVLKGTSADKKNGLHDGVSRENERDSSIKSNIKDKQKSRVVNSDDTTKKEKKPTNIDIVIESIKKSDVPQSYEDIANATGLKKDQVQMAMSNMRRSRFDDVQNMMFDTRKHTRPDSSEIDIVTVKWKTLVEDRES